MSARVGARRGPPAKRLRVQPTHVFSGVEDIRVSLRTQHQDELTKALTALRNQLTIKFGESPITPLDERLVLAQQWLESVPGAHEIFELWESATQRQTTLVALLLSVLSALLALLSSHYISQPIGYPIIKTLLSPQWIRRLNSFVGGSHAELILVTLKLFNSMSAFAGGRERKAVLESFSWGSKSLSKLLHMRRKVRSEETIHTLARPDIRTLYLLFVLSFVDIDSPTLVKTTFLEQHRDVFLSIFKGLSQDSYPVVLKVLEVCWCGVWSDPKVKRTVKVGLFNETAIGQIIKLYDRASPEGVDPDHVPADLAHHFLLAICTRPGTGICFKDRGWYPRESENEDRHLQDEDEPQSRRGGKIHNKILANVLKTLKVNEDARQQEFALKVMAACPELVSGYWGGAGLTLEPRLSSKWVTNISFLGSVISLPIPSQSFSLPNSTLYQPSPPTLTAIMENIFPSVNTKGYLSKGLQSTSSLVQHCTALALAKCLIKYADVVRMFQKIEQTLEEDGDDGQWCNRRREMERESRKRVPDFQVIVAFSQQRAIDTPSTDGRKPNAIRDALLAESAQRLLLLYRQCLPSIVDEARFDVGKLLQNFISDAQLKFNMGGNANEGTGDMDVSAKLHDVRQLHVLRLLKDSDQFRWSGKPASSPHTYLYVLLKAYNVTAVPATRVALRSLLCHILSESILFQEDADEPSLWLAALPTTRRSVGAEAPDGAPLTDEGDSVINFLDDCVQRCLKTPYRYIEEMYTLVNTDTDQSNISHGRPDAYPSPLVVTVLEQLGAKVPSRLLSPSDVLALASFVRKLIFKLLTKQQNVKLLQTFADKVDALLLPDLLFPQHPLVTAAIRREVSIMHHCLGSTRDVRISQPSSAGTVVQDFLNEIENIPLQESKGAGVLSAFELIDWLRLVDYPLSSGNLRRLVVVLERHHKPAFKEFCENLHPGQGVFWEGLNVLSQFSRIRHELEFEWLFAQARDISDAACRNILVETLFTKAVSPIQVKRALCLVVHHLSFSGNCEAHLRDLFLLLGAIMRKAQSTLTPSDVASLSEYLFLQSSSMADFVVSEGLSDVVVEGLAQFVEIALDPSSDSDRKLVADITAHFVSVLKVSLNSGDTSQVPLTKLWIKYLDPETHFNLVDFIGNSISRAPDALVLEFLTAVLHALRRSSLSSGLQSEAAARNRLTQLVTLRSIMRHDLVLEEMIAAAVTASLPIGLNGHSSGLVELSSLTSIIARAEARWSRQSGQLSEDLQLHTFLAQGIWTDSTVQIISGLLYHQSSYRSAFLVWLTAESSTSHSALHLAGVLHAFLDSSHTQEAIAGPEAEALIPHFSRLLETILDITSSEELRSICASCLCLMITQVPFKRPIFITLLESTVSSLSFDNISSQLLILGKRLLATLKAETNQLIIRLVDHGLQWAVRCCTDDSGDTKETQNVVKELITLVQATSDLKPHLVETVLTAVVKHRLGDIGFLDFLSALVRATPLKPLTVNRHLQSILQHPRFFKFCIESEFGISPLRDSIISLLHILFHTHPTNTCQPTHVDPLVRIYSGTCSPSDRQLLSIFHSFEAQRKTSVASLITRWSPSLDATSSSALDAIQNLDPTRVLRTCLAFPNWRRFHVLTSDRECTLDRQIYDPVFLILLFARMLSESPPSSASAWVELFRTNIICFLIRCISSKDPKIRELALCQIIALWKLLETADMQEKPHVVYILNQLKNSFPQPSDEPPVRLPSYSSLILLHAIRGIFYPSNFIFPLTARFLLQRPELDTADVPMLYGMLYSSSDDWKKERGWIIRFLADGMASSEDWKVLKRRHTWDLLASFFQTFKKDHSLRNGILGVLANLTCNSHATMSLVLKSGLLTWIEMQLTSRIGNEGIVWLKILQNIIAVVDCDKLETSTSGEWRSVIYRCLSLLLDDCHLPSSMSSFGLAASTMLRFSLLRGRTLPQLPSLLVKAVGCLKTLEKSTDIQIHGQATTTLSKRIHTIPPHTAYEIHDPLTFDHPLQIWGESVEALWRVAMCLEDKHSTWDGLTCRVLVWRSITGEEGSFVGEWARREVVRNMHM